jgi:outer membrane receptor protein involved in Fe transport
LSFIDSRSRQQRAIGDPADPQAIPGIRNRVKEGALFGELSFPVMGNVVGSAGARLARYRTQGGIIDDAGPAGAAIAARSETVFLPSASVTYAPSDAILLYARYQSGFRPGGVAILSGVVERYRSDRTNTLEAGVRVRGPLGLPLEATATGVYTRWRDVQADLIDLGNLPRTANVGDARIYTADLSLVARPRPDLRIEAAAVWNDSLITNRLPGIIYAPESPLPNVARLVLRVGAEYQRSLPGSRQLSLSAAARYTGKSILGVGYLLDAPQGGWTEVGLTGRLTSGRRSLTATISNLLGMRGNRFALGSPFLLQQQQQSTPLQPRTLRVAWETAF